MLWYLRARRTASSYMERERFSLRSAFLSFTCTTLRLLRVMGTVSPEGGALRVLLLEGVLAGATLPFLPPKKPPNLPRLIVLDSSVDGGVMLPPCTAGRIARGEPRAAASISYELARARIPAMNSLSFSESFPVSLSSCWLVSLTCSSALLVHADALGDADGCLGKLAGRT